MTRIWGLPPVMLCRNHLLGLHKECHQEIGTRINHPHGEKIVDGHAKKKQVDTSLIREEHDKAVKEMKNRGFQHDDQNGWIKIQAPLPIILNHRLQKGSINRLHNFMELTRRCKKCRRKAKKHLSNTQNEPQKRTQKHRPTAHKA